MHPPPMHVWLVSVPFPPHVESVTLMSQHQVMPRILNQPKVNAIDALMDRECWWSNRADFTHRDGGLPVLAGRESSTFSQESKSS